MSTQKNLVVRIVCALALMAWAGSASADMLTNGGFEAGSLAGWTNDATPPYVVAVTTDAYQGNYAAQLEQKQGGSAYLAQFATIAAGDALTLSFATKKTAGVDFTKLEIKLQADDGTNYVNLLTGPNGWYALVGTGTYVVHTYNVTVPTDHTYNRLNVLIGIGQESPIDPLGSQTPSVFLVDSVSLAPVPEPSALALLAVGLSGLLGCGWRKRN